MFKKVVLIHCLLLFNLNSFAKEHPFLFTTQDDVQRARKTVKVNKDFAKIAEDLIKEVEDFDKSKLKELDFDWFEKRVASGDVNLHTYHRPLPWSKKALACARASIFKPELASKAREILLYLADYRFAKLPNNSGLNHARVAYPALDAYDIIYDTLSDADRAKIDGYFHRMIVAVIEDNDYWLANNPGGIPVNNHVCWHNLCMGMYGLFYNKPEMVERALYNPRGVEFMMNFGFRDTGIWGEASIMYQMTATDPILIMAEMLENANYPVSLYSPTADGRDLKQAYDTFFNLVYPDLMNPRVGDTYGRMSKLSAGMRYEILYTRFGDPKYAWLINKSEKRDPSALFCGKVEIPKVEDISIESELFREHGYAFLRTNEGPSYWNGQGWTLMANFSSVYVHRHLDKLSINLYGDGHLWLTDPGQKFIGKGMQWDVVKGLNRQTISHNTVLVDNKTQNDLKRELDLVEYSSLPAVKRVTIADYSSQLYPGVKQMRTCIAAEGYVLDVFQVVSKEDHIYKWVSHVSGKSEFCSIDNFRPTKFPDEMPWKYLKNPERSRLGITEFTERFSSEDKKFCLDVTLNSPGVIFKSDYCLDDRKEPETEPTIMFETKAKEAIYAAVYRTRDVEKPVHIKLEPAVMHNLLCEVKIGDKKYLHRIPQLSW